MPTSKSRKSVAVDPSPRVLKVIQALGRYRRQDDALIPKALKVYISGTEAWILMDKRGVFTCTGRDHLHGVIGARYNTGVYEATRALTEFKVITEADRIAFLDWLRTEETERNKTGELRDLKEKASRLGMKLVPE